MSLRNFSNFVIVFAIINGFFYVAPSVYELVAKCTVFLASLYLAEVLMSYSRKFFLHDTVSPRNKAVFITGCDSGFGHELSKRIDQLGYRVFAGCLLPEGEGANELKTYSSSRLTIIPLDVTSDNSVQAAVGEVTKSLASHEQLWAVVNNAGIAHGCELDWTSLQQLERVLQVNTIGMARVTKAFLPLIREARGRVVNITSMCGKFICPGFIPYCMSKSAAIVFTTGLRMEMKKWGVKAISIEPFFYRTPITNAERVVDMVEQTWQEASPQIRNLYGEKYKETFMESCRELLERSSDKVHEVIDCLEDAVTAKDPLSTYNPAFLPHKLGITVLDLLPQPLKEAYLREQLEKGQKPAFLSSKQKPSVFQAWTSKVYKIILKWTIF